MQQTAPPGDGEAAATKRYRDCPARRSLYTDPQHLNQAPDTWRRLGDVVSSILVDIIARRYDVTREHARVVVEHNFNIGDKS